MVGFDSEVCVLRPDEIKDEARKAPKGDQGSKIVYYAETFLKVWF